MAGVLLRQAQRWRMPFLRLASLTIADAPKHSSGLASSDLARVLGALNSLLHVPAHAPSITLRSFSTGRPLGLADDPKPTSHALSHDTEKTGGWSRDQVFNLPNGLSMARLLSGPVIAAWIIDGQWSIAVPALVISGVTDWLDGYFARRARPGSAGGATVLGSYLDPLADKVLVGCVVGALGYTGALPAPLVAVVLGRDVALLGGAFAIRAHRLGWRWPGAREFFRIAPAKSPLVDEEAGERGENSESSPAPAAPVVKPLLISKVNTGFQLALVGACMTDAWLGWPGEAAVWGLGWATAGTTVASCVAYGRAFFKGQLLI